MTGRRGRRKAREKGEKKQCGENEFGTFSRQENTHVTFIHSFI
jgi:hypothetical protein